VSRTHTRRLVIVGGAAGALAAGFWLWGAHRIREGGRLPPGRYEARVARDWEVPEEKARALRDDALARARVWRPPAVPIEEASLTRNPSDPDPLDTRATLACRFLPSEPSGTTPKFECTRPGGEVLKVKYGRSPEIHAEVAASRLLTALGFGADRMYLVPRLRCFGCPAFPFTTNQILEATRTQESLGSRPDPDEHVEFQWVAVERRLRASTITAPGAKGWAFYELERIDPGRGGSSRPEVDALRLMAAFLHHWDNKAENQRLVCLAEPKAGDNGPCPRPFAFMQDVGATFGPSKVDFAKWAGRPLWSDAATCELSMKDMPYEGATFGTVRITEAGRAFLAQRLRKLSEKQIRDLFTGARFPSADPASDAEASVEGWVRAFQEKVRAIADRPPCPS
jgi:hypothetical protein